MLNQSLTSYLTPQERERARYLLELKRAREEQRAKPVRFDELFIRTKDKRLIPFTPNEVQAKYLTTICPDWEEGGLGISGLREILLKARQFGFSTLIEALFFQDTVNTPNTNTVVIADDATTTAKLFRMVQIFWEKLPDDKRPRAKYASKTEFYWPELNSSFYVGTAGNRRFGRGDTINNLHGSEVAYWENAADLLSGLLEAVPRDGNVFLETTANGIGNYYHSEYMGAKEGRSRFKARFFGWHEHPEYALPLTSPLEPNPEPEEAKAEDSLRRLFSLSDGQIAWRREKRLSRKLREKFPQEYPATAEEAFLSSGNPYFDRQKLSETSLALNAEPTPLIEIDLPERLARLERGDLKIWKAPEAGRCYVLAADTAEGLTDSGDSDFDSADVLDSETWEQVCHLHGKWDPHEYGLMLADLGFLYNTALLAIERNNHGHAVINAALHGAGYPHEKQGIVSGLYFHEDYDIRTKEAFRRPGFPTTSKTKTMADDALARAIDEDDLVLNCIESITECISYVKLPGGKAAGEKGSHDDRVRSLAIGVGVTKLRPPKKERKLVWEVY